MRTLAVLLTLVGGLAGIVAYGASQRPDVFGDIITLINTSLLSLPEGTWGKGISLPQRPQGYTPYALGTMGAVTVLFLLIIFRLARTRRTLARCSRAQEEEIATLQAQVHTLEGQLQCLAEPRVLEERLRAEENRVVTLQEEAIALSQKIDDLTERKDELQERIVELAQQSAKYEGENVQLKAREEQVAAREARVQMLWEERMNSDRLPANGGD